MKEKRWNGLIPIYSVTSFPSLAASMGRCCNTVKKLKSCRYTKIQACAKFASIIFAKKKRKIRGIWFVKTIAHIRD